MRLRWPVTILILICLVVGAGIVGGEVVSHNLVTKNHVFNPDWVSTLITALAAFVAAVVGGIFVLLAANRSFNAASLLATHQRNAERDAAELQYSRQLLVQAAERLLDALWSKERELCDALNLCREEISAGRDVSLTDPATSALGKIDLAINRDLIGSLPFVRDDVLRERLRTAGQMVNDCYNLRAGSSPDTVKGGTIESLGRAMIEVQAYFRWLRWNLVCALEGQPLPPEVDMPNIKRAEGGAMWSAPSEVPRWT